MCVPILKNTIEVFGSRSVELPAFADLSPVQKTLVLRRQWQNLANMLRCSETAVRSHYIPAAQIKVVKPVAPLPDKTPITLLREAVIEARKLRVPNSDIAKRSGYSLNTVILTVRGRYGISNECARQITVAIYETIKVGFKPTYPGEGGASHPASRELAASVRARMAALGWDRKNLAAAIGCTPNHVSNVLSPTGHMTVAKEALILKALSDAEALANG